MKITYFLRGLGAGIIFCTIILFAAYKTCAPQISDEDVVKRAKELGMVDASKDSEVDDFFAKADAEKNSTKKDTEAETTENNKKVDSSEEKKDLEKTSESVQTETSTAEETTTESATTEADTTENTSDLTKKKDSQEKENVTFTITSGMYSETVSAQLAGLGVIKDADEFNQYLSDNGYASRLVTGTYSFTPGEDYASIAHKISR